METLCRGEIIESNRVVFVSETAIDDKNQLLVTLAGIIRVSDPQQFFSEYTKNISIKLPSLPTKSVIIDFSKFVFCNSTGFYLVLDIVESIYCHFPGTIIIRRLLDSEWQIETLPILLRAIGEQIIPRTIFEDINE